MKPVLVTKRSFGGCPVGRCRLGRSVVTNMRSWVAVVALVVMTEGAAAPAQSPRGARGGERNRYEDFGSVNVRYDGRFTFARLRYPTDFGGFAFRREPPWAHDYPTADTHLSKILREISAVDARVDGSVVLALEDPELTRYPIAYMSEPGFWTLDGEQALALRHYLLKGGFVIFDDFFGDHWDNFESQMRRVMPEGRLVLLDGSHPAFHSFFEIDSPEKFVPPYVPYQGLRPHFYGMFEDNDPAKRLLLVANYNNDLGEYWEFSDTGFVPVDLSNEAYKFGVNYVVYGLTH